MAHLSNIEVQVLKDGDPEIISTVHKYSSIYRIIIPGTEEEFYATVTYEERNYEALSENLKGMLYCTEINLEEIPAEHVKRVESQIKKSLTLEGIELDDDVDVEYPV
jgi:hypothetical protein